MTGQLWQARAALAGEAAVPRPSELENSGWAWSNDTMSVTPDPARLYTDHSDGYERFIRLMLYPRGLRAFFRQSPLLRSGLRVLDAGCGTGVVTLALREAMVSRRLKPGSFDCFDLTPAMLARFRTKLTRKGITDITLAEADVLELDGLDPQWARYDLVITASMLEYVPRDQLAAALGGLRQRLGDDGRLLLFITRDNWLMRPLIGRWWSSNLYSRRELRQAFEQAGFSSISFHRFPSSFRFLDLWGHIVEARP